MSEKKMVTTTLFGLSCHLQCVKVVAAIHGLPKVLVNFRD